MNWFGMKMNIHHLLLPRVDVIGILYQPLEHVPVLLMLGQVSCVEQLTQLAVVRHAGVALYVVVRTPGEVRVEESFVMED